MLDEQFVLSSVMYMQRSTAENSTASCLIQELSYRRVGVGLLNDMAFRYVICLHDTLRQQLPRIRTYAMQYSCTVYPRPGGRFIKDTAIDSIQYSTLVCVTCIGTRNKVSTTSHHTQWFPACCFAQYSVPRESQPAAP